MSNQFERTRALTDQPLTKIREVVIEALDADGGRTRVNLSGDSINMELMPGCGDGGGWIGVRESGKKAIMRSHPFTAGHFVARGVEYADVTYTEPPKPFSLFKVGDLVKVPPGVAPEGYPYRSRGPVVQVTAVAWNSLEKQWGYSFLDRSGKHVFEADEKQLRHFAKKVDRWPLRRGDFVKVHSKHCMGDEVFKLARRVDTQDGLYPGEPAWWLDSEDGPTNTWLRDEDAVLVDDVKVVKTVKWERG